MNFQSQYYFLLLRRAYCSVDNHTEVQITIDAIAQILFCTYRNVKFILNKWIEAGLVEFKSGKGRGNVSTIIFLEDLNTCLLKQIQTLMKDNEMNKALVLVKEFGKGTEVEDYVINWITDYFGYKKMKDHGRDLEILRFPIYRPITTVDPSQVFFDFDAHLVLQVFNTLITYDFNTNEFTGSLAYSWECNMDKTKWIFMLRKGVKFHNGKELTAADVKSSILRLTNSAHEWLVEDIVEIEVQSTYTISFLLKNPNHLFLHYVSFPPMSIVDTSQSYDGFFEFPIGTGPFKLEKIQSDSCVLEAFGSYFGYRPHLDRIEIIRISEEIKGSLEEFEKMFLDTGETRLDKKTNWENRSYIFSGTNVITLNTVKKGPLQNVAFRKLLTHMIDREKLTMLGNPRLQPANGFLIHHEKDIPENKKLTHSEIKEKLENIGYQGEHLTLITYSRHALDARAIRNMLAEFGIPLKIKIVDWNQIQRRDVLNEVDIVMFEGTPNEGIISFFELIFCKQGFIYPFLDDQLRVATGERINQIKREVCPQKRTAHSRALEKFLIENGVIVFLVHKQVEVSYDYSLEGVKFNSRMWIDFKDLWYKHIHL